MLVYGYQLPSQHDNMIVKESRSSPQDGRRHLRPGFASRWLRHSHGAWAFLWTARSGDD